MHVHPENNPGNIEYNSTLLVFVKSWFIPVEHGGTSDDRWLRVPAVHTKGFGGQDVYTPININLETVSMMVLTDEGVVRKAPSVPQGKKMPKEEFDAILKDVFDIPEWEKTTGQAWPYALMFAGKLVRERYQAKFGNNNAPFGSVLSQTSISYNNARRAVMSRPCNCGKK